ncbi:RDD family protein [Dermatophilaceae bacterium Soc4.6]
MEQRPGWYDDPEDPLYLRYFDGVIWTKNRQPKASPTASRSSIGYAGPPGTLGGPAAGGPADTRGVQGPPVSGWGQQTPPHPPQQPPQGPQGWGQPGPQGWGQPPQQGWSQAPQYGPAYSGGYAGPGVATTPDGQPLAGWGTRLGAWIIDSVLQGVVSAVVGSYWLIDFFRWYVDYIGTLVDQQNPVVDQATLQSEVVSRLFPYLVVSILVQVAYQVVFLRWKGATPGKLLLKLQVRRRDRPGPPDLLTILRRLALPLLVGLVSLPLQFSRGSGDVGAAGLLVVVSLLLNVVQLLDYLWPLWDQRNQALHDKIAATNVVVTPPKGR